MKQLTFLMVLLYFIQAACVNPGLAQLPVAKYLEEELQFTAAELAGFQAIIFLPWFIKPAWGILVDSVPLLGYRLKSYFFICYGLVLTSFLILGQIKTYTLTSIPIRQSLNTLKQAIQSARSLAILTLVICLGLAPKLPIYIYQSRVLLFKDEFIGQLKAVEFLGLGLGAVCFGFVAQRCSQKQLLSSIILFSALASFVFIFMQDAHSAVWVSLLAGFATAIATLGILDLFTTVCTKGNEATTYALLVSILNLVTSLGLLLGSWLYDLGLSFPILVGICTASACASGVLVLLLKPLRCN